MVCECGDASGMILVYGMLENHAYGYLAQIAAGRHLSPSTRNKYENKQIGSRLNASFSHRIAVHQRRRISLDSSSISHPRKVARSRSDSMDEIAPALAARAAR